jgi:hypothetical protein
VRQSHGGVPVLQGVDVVDDQLGGTPLGERDVGEETGKRDGRGNLALGINSLHRSA